ncbi:MAG: phosphoenolpyruvate carboxykinase, partial [Candidatus Omnitrophota bacterium]
MSKMYLEILESKLSERDYQKLNAIANPKVQQFIAESCALCNPESIFICSDSPEDIAYVRQQAVSSGEERPLTITGHTYHFDGMQDQGRDREVTKYLVPREDSLNKTLNQIEREEGLTEVKGFLKGAMQGRTMIVRFLSLGPTNSVFSIPCVQCTDSWYVAHSEDLLYRPAYDMFTQKTEQSELFCILHSAGKMNEDMVSVETDKKRIYIDYTKDTIYSVNTQYAGNTVGLKKLALRLTIRKADKEGWLAEHML